MAISKEEVKHVAELARLELSEEETERFTTQLNQIITYAAKLGELDVASIPPTAHALPLQNVWREDHVRPSLPRDEVLANAPEAERGMFRVPRIMEEE